MPGFGGLFVLLFAPYVADGLGRKKGTAVGCVIVIVGALMQCFPQNGHGPRRDALYLVGRFIMGCGSNISNATCPLLITEIAHPRHRGKITTVYNTLWYLGSTGYALGLSETRLETSSGFFPLDYSASCLVSSFWPSSLCPRAPDG